MMILQKNKLFFQNYLVTKKCTSALKDNMLIAIVGNNIIDASYLHAIILVTRYIGIKVY
jgi:hypothetical protein